MRNPDIFSDNVDSSSKLIFFILKRKIISVFSSGNKSSKELSATRDPEQILTAIFLFHFWTCF